MQEQRREDREETEKRATGMDHDISISHKLVNTNSIVSRYCHKEINQEEMQKDMTRRRREG